MKKFSVLFVLMLAVLMVFVGCENKPKERAATEEDASVIQALLGGSMYMAFEKPTREGVSFKGDKESFTVTFNNAELKAEDSPMRKSVVICGELSMSSSDDKDSTIIDFTKGTSLDGKAHTLKAKVVFNSADPTKSTYEVELDGYILTDVEKI